MAQAIGLGRRASAVLLLVYMWVLFSTNTSNLDYGNYRFEYSLLAVDPAAVDRESGYSFLAHVAASSGMDFVTFRAVLGAVALLCLWALTARAGNALVHIVWIPYLFFPFFVDAVQIRNFAAYSLVMGALAIRLKTKGPFGILLQAILTALASLIHVFALAYLVFLLVDPDSETRVRSLEVMAKTMIVVSILFAVTNTALPGMNDALAQLLGDDGAATWATRSGRSGFLVYWAGQLGALYFMSRAWRLSHEPTAGTARIPPSQRPPIERVALVAYEVNLLATAFLPLYVYQSTYTRLYRNTMVLSFLFVVACFLKTKSPRSRQATWSLAACLAFTAFALLYQPYFSEVVLVGLEDNAIVRWFR